MKVKLKNNFKKGFSIGEILIALFVLAFGTLTAIYLMSGSMQDTMRSRDLLVASNLSQEGTELMRNIRDNNVTEKDVISGVRDNVFEGFPASSGNCTVDYEYDVNTPNNGEFRSVLDCSSPSYELYFKENDEGVVFYTHQKTNKLTKFKRKIMVSLEKEGVKKIVSMVVWNDKDFPSSVDDCNLGQDCVFSETALTAWLNFED